MADDEMVAWLDRVLDRLADLARSADADITVWDGERRWVLEDLNGWRGGGYINNDYVCIGPPLAEHVFAQDPRAVLARVEAERKLLARLDLVENEQEGNAFSDAADLADEVRQALAHGHRFDAPGYRPEWSPK